MPETETSTRTRALAAAIVCLSAACGSSDPILPTRGVTDSLSATKSVAAVNAALERASQAATPVTKGDAVSLTVPCDSGSATATLETSDDGAGTTTASWSFTFNRCSRTGEILSGRVTWATSTTSGGGVTTGSITYDGQLAYEGPTYAGNYSFNMLRISYRISSTGVSYTSTGTYSIGGTTYAIDDAALTVLFGGG